MDQDRYVSDVDVSKITGRAVQTLRNDRFMGKGIPYVKLNGRQVRYRLSDVYRYMEAHRVQTNNEMRDKEQEECK